MKKMAFLCILLVVLCLIASCGGDNPQESSAVDSGSETLTESSQYISAEESSTSEPAGDDTAPLSKPYFDIINTGEYRTCLIYAKPIGGEAPPYIVTTYYKNDERYVIINENNGAISSYIVKDNKIIFLDSTEKVAVISDYDQALDENPLWTGKIEYLPDSSGKIKIGSSDYESEKFVDETGFEFELIYDNEFLVRYKSYDEKQKDDITKLLTIDDIMDDAVFSIPSGYAVEDYTTK